MARFSLIMPTKDRPAMILEAILAISDQDFRDWELLIEDGGQSIESILPKDSRIKWRPQEDPLDRRGNAVLLEAQGEIISYQADDDILLPGALSYIDETIEGRKWMHGRVYYGCMSTLTGENGDFEKLKTANIVPAPVAFWTREARDIVGGWDMDNPRSHDWDYWLRLGARWEPFFTSRVMAIVRVHPAMATMTMSAEYKSLKDGEIRGRIRAGYYDRMREEWRRHGDE